MGTYFIVVVKLLSRVWVIVTPWTIVCQGPLSMELSRQEYWSGLPFCSLGDLPDPGIKPGFPALQTDSLPSEPPGKPACLSMITSERVPPSQLFSIISSSFLLSNFHHL